MSRNMKKVKITVLRKEFYEDFAEEYLTEGVQAGSCALLNVGGAKMPDGIRPVVFKVEAVQEEV